MVEEGKECQIYGDGRSTPINLIKRKEKGKKRALGGNEEI